MSRERLATPCSRAGNGTRTRDPNLGKVVLYQLSYSRVAICSLQHDPAHRAVQLPPTAQRPVRRSGGEGNRTPDLLNAIQALSQLSYAPRRRAAADCQGGRQETRSIVGGIGEVKKFGAGGTPSGR